jgi:hypothetical protein
VTELNLIKVDLSHASRVAIRAITLLERYLLGELSPARMLTMERARSDAMIIRADANLEIEDRSRIASQRLVRMEVLRQEEFAHIVERAVPFISDTGTDEEPSLDWIDNLYRNIPLDADDEIKDLWARVLAGEISSPGKFTKRTVKMIAELERNEAQAFAIICGYMVKLGGVERLIWMDWDAAPYQKAAADAVITLDAAGLVQLNSGYFAMTGLKAGRDIEINYFGQTFVHRLKRDSLELGHVILTPVGKQIRLLVNAEPVEGFFEYLQEIYR